eukprot:211593_1
MLRTKMSYHRSVWVIGYNHEGQLGIGNKITQKQLIKCDLSENIQVRNIYTAHRYTVAETVDGNYYSSGDNSNGACTVKDKSENILTMTPITCLKENNLKISQVFVNNNGFAPFWKTDTGSIYTSCNSNLCGRVDVEVDRN